MQGKRLLLFFCLGWPPMSIDLIKNNLNLKLMRDEHSASRSDSSSSVGILHKFLILNSTIKISFYLIAFARVFFFSRILLAINHKT